MLVRRLRLNSGLAFDFAEGARASPRRSTASQHKRHSFRPRHSAGTPAEQADRFDPSARPDLRAAWTFNRIVGHPIFVAALQIAGGVRRISSPETIRDSRR